LSASSSEPLPFRFDPKIFGKRDFTQKNKQQNNVTNNHQCNAYMEEIKKKENKYKKN
jgi:hypothetical protein